MLNVLLNSQEPNTIKIENLCINNSSLFNIEKILEKLLYKRVYQFLTENNFIYDLQFGFRQKFSTAHSLINLIENIRQALDIH